MKLAKTIFQNSAIFIDKKWVENRLWGKGGFLWGKRINSLEVSTASPCKRLKRRKMPRLTAKKATATQKSDPKQIHASEGAIKI